jgi:hypothetical protein
VYVGFRAWVHKTSVFNSRPQNPPETKEVFELHGFAFMLQWRKIMFFHT